jgi:16S rRNA (guanine966-N2)-methyltransferase
LRLEGFEGAHVLDAFAGSGALGLEALSRGARYVTFCERDRRALGVLRANCELFDAAHEETSVLAADVFTAKASALLRLSAQQHGLFDIVFLDPPYSYDAGKIEAFLRDLAALGCLSDGALISYERQGTAGERGGEKCGERDEGQSVPCSLPDFCVVSCKTYGLTRIDYLRYR